MSTPASPLLSPSQLATLAEIGEERSAPVGELLYQVGDRTYPFIAILEGEVAIVDAAGNELIRHGPSGFLGELNLLSGQTVFVNALVTEPLRYIAVERAALRSLLNEDGPLSDLVLSTFISRREALQSVQGIGLEIVGPHASESTMRMLDFARANRLPYTWQDAAPAGGWRARRSCGFPAGESCTVPTAGQVMRALGIGLELAPREEVDLLIVGGRPRRPRGRGLRRLRRARHARRRRAPRSADRRARPAGSRTTSASLRGSAAPSSRAARSPRRGSSGRAPRRPTAPWRSSPGTAGISCGSRTTGRSPRAPSCSRPVLSTGASRSTASRSSRA